ncbi:hypothetical protein NDU88_003205 [Pleurodeles waltl]|uniref:Uncharacterized protein n=1 Tax=Pleurodeles waltl TaxID=8319 RepID=A0AAV7T4K3_PLEWA|nr:hypothetical protein NDU88_003205 [Pleurodeles waltl]
MYSGAWTPKFQEIRALDPACSPPSTYRTREMDVDAHAFTPLQRVLVVAGSAIRMARPSALSDLYVVYTTTIAYSPPGTLPTVLLTWVFWCFLRL